MAQEIEQQEIELARCDPEAFGWLYDRLYEPIFKFLAKRTGNVEVAKDLTSETFFQALKNLSRFSYRGPTSFKCWVYAIAVAQAAGYFRSRKCLLPITFEECPELAADAGTRPDVVLARSEEERNLQNELDRLRLARCQLNEKQQNVLSLKYDVGMDAAEIGRVLGMKETTVRSHQHRAIKKLRVLLSENKSYDNVQQPSFARRSPRRVGA